MYTHQVIYNLEMMSVVFFLSFITHKFVVTTSFTSLFLGRICFVKYLINPLALELDIYSLAHHLCKM